MYVLCFMLLLCCVVAFGNEAAQAVSGTCRKTWLPFLLPWRHWRNWSAIKPPQIKAQYRMCTLHQKDECVKGQSVKYPEQISCDKWILIDNNQTTVWGEISFRTYNTKLHLSRFGPQWEKDLLPKVQSIFHFSSFVLLLSFQLSACFVRNRFAAVSTSAVWSHRTSKYWSSSKFANHYSSSWQVGSHSIQISVLISNTLPTILVSAISPLSKSCSFSSHLGWV